MTELREKIDVAHNNVHKGKFYTACNIFNSVANTSSAEVLIQVGSNKKLHFVKNCAAGGDAEVFLFEGTTFSAAGTSITAYNLNRSSSSTTDATITHTPTLTADGTQINCGFIPGGGIFGAGGSNGGPIRSGTEIVLDVNTDYLIRLTNTSGGAQDMSIEVGYYESD